MSTENATGTRAIDRAADLVALVVRSPNPLSFSEIQLTQQPSRARRHPGCCRRSNARACSPASSGAFTPGALFVAYAARHRPESALLAAAEPVAGLPRRPHRRDGQPRRRPR